MNFHLYTIVDKEGAINIFIELWYKMFQYITHDSLNRPVEQIFLSLYSLRDEGT